MTLARTPIHENRILLSTDWEGYGRLLEMAEHRHVHVTYDRGEVELMSPSWLHERLKNLLRKVLEECLRHRRQDYLGGGETTLRDQLKDRGLEPDECFWIANRDCEPEREWNSERHPPPDLALEIEVSRGVLNRLAIYADLGVPEVWRYTADHEWSVGLLRGSSYEWQDRSPTFPELTPGRVASFVRLGLESRSDTRMVLALADWLQAGALE